ncbi:hypothetical protein Tco_1478893, partial [Tanacetum coccineum]
LATAKVKIVNGEVQIQALVDGKKADENVTQTLNDPLLSGEDRLKFDELMGLCTKLSERVLDLENTKASQDSEITKLKMRVQKLEKKSRPHKHKSATTTTVDELTLAHTLIKIKAAKPKDVTTAATTITTAVTRPKARRAKDKGKAKVVEPEVPLKKKDQERLDMEVAAKLQAEFDEEERIARKEVERQEKANIALNNS